MADGEHLHRALVERVKELTCLYQISQIAARDEIGLDTALDEIVAVLPQAWQHPDLACARIVVDEVAHCSADFVASSHRLCAEIVSRSSLRGSVEVCYRPDRTPSQGNGRSAFLIEEHHLIEGVARELSSLIERRESREERERLQAQLQHADRLATVGHLAAGVAHELNEPLASILGFAQLASKGVGVSSGVRTDLEKIVAAALYAREIIKNLLLFTRQAPSRRRPVDLSDVVKAALSLLKLRCDARDIELRCELGEALEVYGDPSQLQQVVVNLVTNAIQAMPTGGALRIAARKDQAFVHLEVSDSGRGITPEHLKHIFVPFFTTKDVGDGTGLGLSVVHGIVVVHGGTIDVTSEPGETQFSVRLPAHRHSDP